MSRRIYTLVRSRQPEELRARYTPLRWAAEFRQVSAEILRLTIAYLEGKRGESRGRKNVNLFLTQEALDHHVNRHRLRATFTTKPMPHEPMLGREKGFELFWESMPRYAPPDAL